METLGSHIEFECNVECKKSSSLPERRGEILKRLEKELKKYKYLSVTFRLWKEKITSGNYFCCYSMIVLVLVIGKSRYI